MNSVFSILLFQSTPDVWSMNGIFILVLSSSVIAAVLTSYFNWLITNETYKNEYYKIILNKRIAAYTKLDSFIGAIQEHYKTQNGLVLKFFRNQQQLDKIFETRESIASQFRWLSNDIINQTVELWSKIIAIRTEMVSRSFSITEELEKSKELNQLMSSLFEKSESDFKKLYKIKKFLKTNKTRP